MTLAIILALLLVLFVALYLIVLRADRIIKTQSEEREKSQRQLAQSEKMASLGQMVAGETALTSDQDCFHIIITYEYIVAKIQDYCLRITFQKMINPTLH